MVGFGCYCYVEFDGTVFFGGDILSSPPNRFLALSLDPEVRVQGSSRCFQSRVWLALLQRTVLGV